MKTDSRITTHAARGQSLVEFALLLPLLMLILIGIVDLGRITATYVILENAAREGARHGASGSFTQAQILTWAQAEASETIVDTSQMTVQCTPSSCTDVAGNPLTVQVSYPFNFITTYLFAGLRTINISTNATFQIQSLQSP